MKTSLLKRITLSLLCMVPFASFGMQDVKIQHAAQQAEADGKDAKAEASADMESAAQPLMVKLCHPMLNDLALDLNSEETITLASFKENIEAQAKEGDDFILARVESELTNNKGERHIKYYDAHSFFKYLFAPEQPYPFNNIKNNLSRLKNAEGMPLVDIDKAPIRDITFYRYTRKESDKGFTLLCTWSKLFAADTKISKVLQLRFYANQNHDKKLKYTSQLLIGNGFYHGNDGFPLNYAVARQFYESLAKQSIYREGNALALFQLGVLYRFGRGVKKDHDKALAYFTRAADQNISSTIRIGALAALGDLYFATKDYKKALDFHTKVAEQSINLQLQAHALVKLGEIYFHGGHGIEKNYNQALEYLTKAATQSNDLEAREKARDLLNTILAARRRAGIGNKNNPNHEHPAPEAGSEPKTKKART